MTRNSHYDMYRWLTPEESKQAFDLMREVIRLMKLAVNVASMRKELRTELEGQLGIVEDRYEFVFSERPVHDGLIRAFEKMADEKGTTVFKEMITAFEEHVSAYNLRGLKK